MQTTWASFIYEFHHCMKNLTYTLPFEMEKRCGIFISTKIYYFHNISKIFILLKLINIYYFLKININFLELFKHIHLNDLAKNWELRYYANLFYTIHKLIFIKVILIFVKQY